jgi:hypothetical protein
MASLAKADVYPVSGVAFFQDDWHFSRNTPWLLELDVRFR